MSFLENWSFKMSVLKLGQNIFLNYFRAEWSVLPRDSGFPGFPGQTEGGLPPRRREEASMCSLYVQHRPQARLELRACGGCEGFAV
jgi:hypothetical protein